MFYMPNTRMLFGDAKNTCDGKSNFSDVDMLVIYADSGHSDQAGLGPEGQGENACIELRFFSMGDSIASRRDSVGFWHLAVCTYYSMSCLGEANCIELFHDYKPPVTVEYGGEKRLRYLLRSTLQAVRASSVMYLIDREYALPKRTAGTRHTTTNLAWQVKS
jgi:hypothetical protein